MKETETRLHGFLTLETAKVTAGPGLKRKLAMSAYVVASESADSAAGLLEPLIHVYGEERVGSFTFKMDSMFYASIVELGHIATGSIVEVSDYTSESAFQPTILNDNLTL
jgi:hypothetical protein